MLAHKAEEEAVAVIEFIKKGYGHVNYGASMSSSIGILLVNANYESQFLQSCTLTRKSHGWARMSKK